MDLGNAKVVVVVVVGLWKDLCSLLMAWLWSLRDTQLFFC